ncbi:GntR family transcriptional regulator [Streptomyces sp. BI20]|uniref:GntR family transcriptional regulator n=1 Tax=Streptomyces sp. BI20 TaxID=3403460 RepID=UPI003C72623A
MPSTLIGSHADRPKYLRIADVLGRELALGVLGPHGRLASERRLAERFDVNRQTVRAALHELRAAGLIVTERRGTRAAVDHRGPERPARSGASAPRPAPEATGPAPEAPDAFAPSPGAPYAAARTGPRGGVRLIGVPPALAELLGMAPGERTLVHRRRGAAPAAGEPGPRDEVSYLAPTAVAADPLLAAVRERIERGLPVDPRALVDRLTEAERRGPVAETLTLTRGERISPDAARLTVRRTLRDPAGRLLAVTDLDFPGWEQITLRRAPSALADTAFSVR